MKDQVVFDARWLDGLASVWGVVQKFGYVNSASPTLMSNFLHKLRPPVAEVDLTVSKSIGRHSDLVPRGIPGHALLAASFLDVRLKDWSDLLTVRQLRHCPDCAQKWFHSDIFQLAHVERCPLHAVKILDCCPECGSAFADLRRVSLAKPYGFDCGCGFGWLPSSSFIKEWSSSIDYSQLFADLAQDVTKWLERLKAFSVQSSLTPRPVSFTSNNGHCFYLSCATKLAGDFPLADRGIGSLRVTRTDYTYRGDSQLNLDRTVTLFKCIRRHLLKRYVRRYRPYFLGNTNRQLDASMPQYWRTTPPIALAFEIWTSEILEVERCATNFCANLQPDIIRSLHRLKGEVSEPEIADALLSHFFGICRLVDLFLQKAHSSNGDRNHFETAQFIGDWYFKFLAPFRRFRFSKESGHLLVFERVDDRSKGAFYLSSDEPLKLLDTAATC